jgi:subtilase family serine protease
VFHIKACPSFEGPRSARCFAHIVTDSRGNPITSTVTRNITPSGYSPSQLRGAYGITGSGLTTTTVAIVDAYGYPSAASDLAVYRSQFGLGNANLTIVNETGGTNLPKSNTGWDQEQALDLDMVSTMCPNCKILLVQASSASFADLAAAVNYAAAHAHVVSNSYGGGENGSAPYAAAYNHAGVAVTASAGDSGYGAQFPATSPYVIAVGGTSLTLNGATRVSETVWSGTGSGCSALYAKQSWQHDPTCKTRMETDVSAVADPNTGVAVYGPATRRGSAWLVFGGTSVAAPLIGGIFGEKNDAVNYASNIYANTGSLNDITSGSNGSCGGTYYCTAEVGYDGPTGLGTPKNDTPF